MSLVATTLIALGLSANPHLDEGRRLFDAMHFKPAEAELRRAIADGGDPEEAREAHDLLARALAAQGRVDDAEKIYGELLSEDPHAPAPTDAAPKVRKAFQRAKESLYPPDYVRLEQLESEESTLELVLVDPWAQVEQLILVEPAIDRRLSINKHRARAPLPAPEGQLIRWSVEARAADGRVLASVAGEIAPVVVAAVPPPPPAKPEPVLVPKATPPAPIAAVIVNGPEPRFRTATYLCLGAAAAATASGAFFGLRSSQSRSALDALEPGGNGRITGLTQPEAFSLERRMQSDALAANGLFAAGATLVGTAIGLWWFGRPGEGASP
jgi:hypothetical protein